MKKIILFLVLALLTFAAEAQPNYRFASRSTMPTRQQIFDSRYESRSAGRSPFAFNENEVVTVSRKSPAKTTEYRTAETRSLNSSERRNLTPYASEWSRKGNGQVSGSSSYASTLPGVTASPVTSGDYISHNEPQFNSPIEVNAPTLNDAGSGSGWGGGFIEPPYMPLTDELPLLSLLALAFAAIRFMKH